MEILLRFIILYSKKKLSIGYFKSTGRNLYGSITVFSKGQGLNNYKYLLINYKYFNNGLGVIVKKFLDWRRSAFIGLNFFQNGWVCYLILGTEVNLMNLVCNFYKFNYKFINYLIFSGYTGLLSMFPINSILYNVEILPFHGGKLGRAAGSYVQIINKYKQYIVLKLKSKKKLILNSMVYGTFGKVSFSEWKQYDFKKAGRRVLLGYKPKVRGVAMNPCDHPHGGGEGKKSKWAAPRTPWGKFTGNSKTKTKQHLKKLKNKFKRYEFI